MSGRTGWLASAAYTLVVAGSIPRGRSLISSLYCAPDVFSVTEFEFDLRSGRSARYSAIIMYHVDVVGWRYRSSRNYFYYFKITILM